MLLLVHADDEVDSRGRQNAVRGPQLVVLHLQSACNALKVEQVGFLCVFVPMP